MTRYTVVWLQYALDQLADIWLQSIDRNAVSDAAARVDFELAEDATNKGAELAEGLKRFGTSPVEVIFAIREEDRIVEIARVYLRH